MSFWDNIISAVGNAANDVGNFFGGGNDNPQKKQQNNSLFNANTNNPSVKLPSIFNASSPGAVQAPQAPSASIFNMPAQNNSNLSAGPVQQPAQHASILHDLTHNPVTNVVGTGAKDLGSAAAGTALAATRIGTGLLQIPTELPDLALHAGNAIGNAISSGVTGQNISGVPSYIHRADQLTQDVNAPINYVNRNLDLASKAFGQPGADIYKPAQIVGNVVLGGLGAADLGANLLTKAGQGDAAVTNVLGKISGQSANRLNPLNLARNTNEAAGAGEVGNVAEDTAPLETPPPETGIKQITETPTNAPPESTAPVTAPGAVESGVKPVAPPAAPTVAPPIETPIAPIRETPPTAVPAPPEVAAAQDAAQQAVNKTADNLPKPVAAPVTAAPAITPAQAASIKAAESPTQQAVDAVPALEKANDGMTPQNARTVASYSTPKPVTEYQVGEKVSNVTAQGGTVDGTITKVPDFSKDLRVKGNDFQIKLDDGTTVKTSGAGFDNPQEGSFTKGEKVGFAGILSPGSEARTGTFVRQVDKHLAEIDYGDHTELNHVNNLYKLDETHQPTQIPKVAPSTPAEPPTDNVINNKDVPTEPAPAPKENTPAPPTDLERNPNAVGNLPESQKLLSSKVQAIRNTNTESGTALADKIDAADARHTELRAGWMHQLKPVFDLNSKDFRDAWNIQEGKLSPDRASQSARDAAATLKSVMPDIQKTADKADVVEGNLGDTYMPHTFKGDKGAPKVNMPINRTTAGRQYGNLEKERLTNAQNYEKTPNALMNYIDKASQRIGQSENFGAKNETAQALLAKIGAEGGDQGTADEAFKNYVNPEFSTNSKTAKALGAVRTGMGVAHLPTAAISHLGQTTNAAVDTGIANTLKAWGTHLSSNPEAADFVDRTGVNNPQSLGHYQQSYTSVKGIASRLTAPGLRPVMKMNRSVTALAYRAYGNALAKAGNVAKLQDLGVTGDIGKTLTDNQELQAARGGVQKTMFSGSNAQTPIKAETTGGRMISQFRGAYALPQTKFIINSVLKEARNGNIAPLARFLTISTGVGAGTVLAKNAITGRKESAGNVAADVAGAAGGIPGEMASGALRYGAKNVVGTIASDIAPAAGEAVKVGTAIQNSLSSKNPTPIERYGLKTVPLAGTRLADKFTPYAPGTSKAQVAAGAKQSAPGIYQVKAKDGTAQFATLDGKSMKNYSTLTDAQAAQAKNEFKYSSTGQKVSSDKAQQTLDKDNFIKSGQQEQSIHGMVYQNEGNGKVSSMQQKDYDYTTADDAMRNAKTNNDLKGYVSGATSLLGNINWQLKHATLTDSQRSTLENKATATANDLAKYKGYGGFTKGKSGKSLGAAITLPSKSGATGLTAGTAKYTAPTLSAYSPSSAKNGNPFIRSITTNTGVK